MKKNILFLLIMVWSFGLMAQNAGKALTFDGTNDFIAISTNYGLTSNSEYTIEFWFKTSTTVASCLFGQSTVAPTATPASFVPTISITTSGTLRAESWTGTIGAITTTFTCNDGKWHYVAFTTTPGTQVLYVDGTQIGTRSGTLNIAWWAVTQIGTGYDANTRLGAGTGWKYSSATIDEVRIWDTALSLNVLNAWCYRPVNSGHPFYSDLKAYYNLNEGSGSTANDTSPNSYNGTLTNFGSAPWVSSYVPMITITNNYKNDIAASWPSKSTSSSSIITVTSTMTGNSYVVYEHNNNALNYNTSDTPSTILKRVSRSWKMEKEGTVTGDIICDYSGLDTSGFYTYKLLASTDTSFVNAIKVDGIKIGNQKIIFKSVAFQDSVFGTLGASPFQRPTVITSKIDEVKAFTAKISGNVTDAGDTSTTYRGVCWSTTANPTTALSTKTSNGTGQGSYQASITGLTPNTTYHVRTYATNYRGTSYGADSSFLTPQAYAPTVLTLGKLTVYANSVMYQGNVTSDGNVTVTERGFCWSTSANPTTSSNKLICGSGKGIFSCTLNGMLRNTTYHIRAYAINAVGTSYGADSIYITPDAPGVKLVQISSIGYYSANIDANVTSDGRFPPVSSRGVCWNTSPNPTLKNSFKASGTGTGSYAVSLSGLINNTTYYIRAYAINGVDTAYSVEDTFITLKCSAPTVITSSPKSITSKGATCGGNVTADGGATVSLRGVCWSINPNPTAKLSTRSVNGTGLGSYSYNITTLIRGTTYHVRAYAINITDTAYGGDSVFTTLDAAKLTLDSVKTVDATKVSCRSTVTSDGGSNVTLRGVCWDTKTGPKPKAPSKFTTDGSGKGSYNSVVGSLLYGITYYIRAYAINGVDTAYSSEFIYVPIVVNTTSPITAITAYSAKGGGNVVSGNNINDRGVVWDINANPTITLSSKTSNGTGTGSYTSSITGLTPNTLYHIRAFATNDAGTAYGNDVTFTSAGKLTVVTGTITITSSSTATCDGNITSDGGLTVNYRGISWSDVSGNELLLMNKTNDGTGTGTFTGNLTGLSPNTLYYIRAYAINGEDTAFGSQKTFIITPPQVITGITSDITKSSAIIYGSVNAMRKSTNSYFEYGETTSYGNTVNSMPSNLTDSVFKTVSAAITGLKQATTYHYRLVAESSHGKSYGFDSVFTTDNTSIKDKLSVSEAIISTSSNQLKVEIRMNGWKEAEVIVTDLSGREIFRQKNFGRILTAELPSGNSVYLVTLIIDKRSYSKKVMTD